MSTSTNPSQARDAGNWAKPIDKLKTSDIPAGALNINVDGKPLTGPIRGFGQMWQKTYRVRLTGQAITPQAVIADWKQNFSSYWPKATRCMCLRPASCPVKRPSLTPAYRAISR